MPEMVSQSLANPTNMPVTPEMVAWARCRPSKDRVPMPEPGARVWYRHDHKGPLTVAAVERVDLSNRDDYNVWRFVIDDAGHPVVQAGLRLMEMVDDPWPDVILRTDWGRVVTRESRIEGSAGWLPMRQES